MPQQPYFGPAGVTFTPADLHYLAAALIHDNTDTGRAIRERVQRWCDTYGDTNADQRNETN